MTKAYTKITFIVLLLLAILTPPLQAAQEAEDDQATKESKSKAPEAWFELAGWGKESLLKDLYAYCDIDINAKNQDGDTALLLSASNGKHDCVNWLLQQGADTDIRGKNDNTALLLSAAKGHTSCVKYLLEQGADTNISRKDGKSALILSSQNKYITCVELLLKHGAYPNIRDNDGHTAFYYLITDSYVKHDKERKIMTLLEARMVDYTKQLQDSIMSTEKTFKDSGNLRLMVIQYWQREFKTSEIAKDIVSIIVGYSAMSSDKEPTDS